MIVTLGIDDIEGRSFYVLLSLFDDLQHVALEEE